MDPNPDIDQLDFAGAMASAVAVLRAISDAPRLEAELLLSHVTGLNRAALLSAPVTLLAPEQRASFERLLARRRHGEPIAYLLGRRDFWTLTLTVTPAVLIPRPETELVVERALTHLPKGTSANVLDLATGSGAIALAIASERPQARVVATDVSRDALEVARRNVVHTGLDHVDLRWGNWYEPVAEERFAIIASNPPYVAAGDADLAADVRAHEPQLALIAGPTGMECLQHIIAGAALHLEPDGWLILEHGWQQAAAVRMLLEQAGFVHVRSHADLAGHDRVTEGQYPAGQRA